MYAKKKKIVSSTNDHIKCIMLIPKINKMRFIAFQTAYIFKRPLFRIIFLLAHSVINGTQTIHAFCMFFFFACKVTNETFALHAEVPNESENINSYS